MQGLKGIPKVYYYGIENKYRILIMERLGPTIKDMQKRAVGKVIPLKTLVSFIPQLIQRLWDLHQRGYIFRDVVSIIFLFYSSIV